MALNYHHLRYFHVVARLGSVTRAALQLRVAQSAISVQLRQLEENLGTPLFDREKKSLSLTEAGRVTLAYADTIFRTGEELLDAIKHRPSERLVLRVGAVATLSRNFQMALLKPVLDEVEVVIHSGSLRDLVSQLRSHTLDLVLANQPIPRDAETPWHSHLLDEQEVCIVGPPKRGARRLKFPEDLEGERLVVPGLESNVRAEFEAILVRSGVRPHLVAEVDDMAMLRLMARESKALALVPRVVVQDELKSKTLVERCRVPDLKETFYAITPTRRFPNAVITRLLSNAGEQARKRSA
jgi:LysR family transcriptional activator of nhaA